MENIHKIIQNARDVLVGKVPDPQSQINQITLALIYKFMDAKDAEARLLGIRPTFFIDDFEDYSFTKILQTPSNPEQFKLYSKGIELLQNRMDLPATFVSVFKDAFIPYRDAKTLHLFLNEINKIPTDNTELLGTAFEDLLAVMGSQGDAGQFRTPRHIIDMIVDIINPTKADKILDPACGTAGFLISAYKNVMKEDLTIEEKESFINEGLVGYDINPDMVKLSMVNLFLHDCKKPNIYLYDTLSEKEFWGNNYDVILANPPFMTPKGGIRPHELFSAINANRSEVLFTYYIAKHLRKNGRAGIIVPEGIVFQTANAYKELRRILVEENYLYAVISLPAGVFNPYSGVKTSILLLDRALARRTDKVLFVKMVNDGFDLGAQRREIPGSQIGQIKEIVKNFSFNVQNESEDKFEDKYGLSLVAEKEQILKNDCILVGDRYKAKEKFNSKFDTVKLGEICNTASGGTPSSSVDEYYKNGTIPWLTSGEVKGFIYQTKQHITEAGLHNSSAKVFPVNTVVIAMYGATAGQVGIIKTQMATNQAVCGIMPNDKLVPEYLYYILKLLKDEMILKCVGGAQPNISQKIIRELLIPLPSIEVQKEIVAEIESYQKIIDGARQVIDNYRPIVNIKQKCETKTLEEVCIEIKNGANVQQIENPGKYRVTRIATIADGTINLNNTKWTNDEVYDNVYMQDGDILFSHINSFEHLAKTAIYHECGEKVVHGINLVRLRPNKSIISPEFLLFILKSDAFINEAKRFAQRAVNQASIKVSDIKKLRIPCPDMTTQIEIVRSINREISAVNLNKELIRIFEQRIKDKLSEIWGDE